MSKDVVTGGFTIKNLFHNVRSDEMQQQKMLVECTDENILKDLKNP